jgi:tetratricopeptide (TPR) repeat protein
VGHSCLTAPIASKSTPGINRMEELDRIIADQVRGNASRRNADSPLLRLAATVHSEVARFRRKNPGWRSEFDFHIANFRFTFYRDADWYAEKELEYERWLKDFESHEGPFDWYTSMPIVFLAEIYHEQCKYAKALAAYRKAIQLARGAIMEQGFRLFVIQWLRVSVKSCIRGKRPIATPAYAGPWLPPQ